MTIKYNSAGVQQWFARYNGPGNNLDKAYAIAIDDLGNVYVTGSSPSLSSYPHNHDFATIKYNANGSEQWVARYNGPVNSDDEAFAIAVDASGNVYVTGWSYGSLDDYATVKYNSAGIQQWVAFYNGGSYDRAKAIALDGQNNVYVTGSGAHSGSHYDFTTIKYNQSGVQQWVARYNGPANSDDFAWAIAVDRQGNVFVTGRSFGSWDDWATIKYNANGVEQWVQRYNGPGVSYDYARAIAVDSSGNVYVTGDSPGSNGYEDYTTVKYNTNGVEQWVAKYNGPGNRTDRAKAIAVDRQGYVYVTGESDALGTYRDYATIKYSQDGVISVEDENLVPSNIQLYQNYPNPFNPGTVISWQAPVGSLQSLKVYDVLGREVATLVNEYKEAGKHSVEFNATGLPSGVYFYRLNAGSFSETKKMILLR